MRRDVRSFEIVQAVECCQASKENDEITDEALLLACVADKTEQAPALTWNDESEKCIRSITIGINYFLPNDDTKETAFHTQNSIESSEVEADMCCMESGMGTDMALATAC